jgi:hypothetical protein
MTVVISAGIVQNGVLVTQVAEQTTSTITAPSVNPRIDRIVIDNVTGVYSIVAGAEAVTPVVPAITAYKTAICQILLETTTTTITDDLIVNERATLSNTAQNAEFIASNWFEESSASFGNSASNFTMRFNDADGYWLAIPGSSGGSARKSLDGRNWTAHSLAAGTYSAQSLFWNGSDLWVTVFLGASDVESSPDGETWTARSFAAMGAPYCVAHDQSGLWVAGGTVTTLETSPDGITWTARTSAFTGSNGIFAVAHDGSGLWAAVGNGGEISTSPDGITWTARTSGVSDTITSVAHDKLGRWVAGTGAGELITSADGITWTSLGVPVSTERISCLEFHNNTWVAADDDGVFITSMDGINWTQRPGVESGVRGAAYGQGHWMAAILKANVILKSLVS